MKKLSVIMDGLLTLAALWLLCAVIIGYFTANTAVIISVSVVAALGGTYFIGILSKLGKRPAAKKKKLEMLRNKFIFSPRAYAHDMVFGALQKKGTVEENGNLLKVTGTAFAVQLDGEKIGLTTLAKLYSEACEAGVGRLVILSALGAETEVREAAAMLPDVSVEIWDFDKTYAFLCYLKSPPTEVLKPRKQKRRLLSPLSVLSRGNARRYLFAAIVTLLFARFFPYSALYVIMAAISLVLAVLCRMGLPERLAKK